MRPSSWLLVPAFAIAGACGKAGDKGAESPGADTMTAATPAPPAAIVTVLYHTPKDAAAFEKYYTATHVPLVVANQQEIGFTRADLTKFSTTLDGKKPTFYRQAELYFDSMDDLQKGVSTPGFKQVADDLSKFASGGLIGMVATTTNDHETGAGEPGAIVTGDLLYFPSMDAAKRGIATPAFKKVGDDLANFADGGLDVLIGVETK